MVWVIRFLARFSPSLLPGLSTMHSVLQRGRKVNVAARRCWVGCSSRKWLIAAIVAGHQYKGMGVAFSVGAEAGNHAPVVNRIRHVQRKWRVGRD